MNTFGPDQAGYISNINITCDPNPCNNGTCKILLGGKYGCLCPVGFIGIFKL